MSAPVKLIIESFLTQDERTSPVWQSVSRRLEEMLAAKRIENDNPNLDPAPTQALRGQIACLKAIIALGKKPPEQVASKARQGPRVDLGAKYG